MKKLLISLVLALVLLFSMSSVVLADSPTTVCGMALYLTSNQVKNIRAALLPYEGIKTFHNYNLVNPGSLEE